MKMSKVIVIAIALVVFIVQNASAVTYEFSGVFGADNTYPEGYPRWFEGTEDVTYTLSMTYDETQAPVKEPVMSGDYQWADKYVYANPVIGIRFSKDDVYGNSFYGPNDMTSSSLFVLDNTYNHFTNAYSTYSYWDRVDLSANFVIQGFDKPTTPDNWDVPSGEVQFNITARKYNGLNIYSEDSEIPFDNFLNWNFFLDTSVKDYNYRDSGNVTEISLTSVELPASVEIPQGVLNPQVSSTSEEVLQNTHLGGLYSWQNAYGGNWEDESIAHNFDPTKDTIVITHGFNSDIDSWIADMAGEFETRLGDVNILAWDWRTAAKYTFAGDICVPDSKVTSESIALSYTLKDVLKDANGNPYEGNIQLLGHSLGSGIVAQTAVNLQHEFSIDRLTLFDGPTNEPIGDVHLEKYLGKIDENVFIENIASGFGVAYNGLDNIKNYALFKEAYQKYVTSSLSIEGRWVGHPYSYDWYISSINDSSSQFGYNSPRPYDNRTVYQNLTPYYQEDNFGYDKEIWADSIYPATIYDPLKRGDWFYDYNNNDVVSRDVFREINPRAITSYEAVLAMSNITSFHSETGSVVRAPSNEFIMTSASPVYLMFELDLPIDADFLSFSMNVLEWHEGDVFAAYWENNLLFSVLTEIYEKDTWNNFAGINLLDWAGMHGTLTFALLTVMDGIHSQIAIDNISFYNYETISGQQPVPEPTTILLFCTGIAGLVAVRRKKQAIPCHQ